MADLDEQFEAFLKEPLTTTEESESISDSFEKNVKIPSQSKQKFWWMKEKPVPDSLTLVKPSVQLKIPSVDDISHPDFSPERNRDDSNLESSHDSADVDDDLGGSKMKKKSVAKTKIGAPSPDFSSSTAEFLAKEIICRDLASNKDDSTEDDISSIMEQMSQILSSSGISHEEMTPSKDVPDILEEAAELVRVSTPTFQKLSKNSLSSSETAKTATTPRSANEAAKQADEIQSKKSDHNEDGRSNEETAPEKLTNDVVEDKLRPKVAGNAEQGKKKEKSVNFKDTPQFEPAEGERRLDETKTVSEKLRTKETNIVVPKETYARPSDVPATDSKNTNLELYSNAVLERKQIRKIKETKSSILKKEFIESKQAKSAASKFAKKDNKVKLNLQFTSDKLNNSTDKSTVSLQVTPTSADEVPADSDIKSTADNVSAHLYDISEESLSEDKIVVATFENKRLLPLSEELKVEKQKYQHLIAQLELVKKDHKQFVTQLSETHAKEMFETKKELCILKAKLDDQAAATPPVEDPTASCCLKLMEDELKKQEQLIQGYQRENLRLCQELRSVQEELKSKEPAAGSKPAVSSVERDSLLEELKDRDEKIVQLKVEIEILQSSNKELETLSKSLKSTLVKQKTELNKLRYQAAYNSECSATAAASPRTSRSLNVHLKQLEKLRADLAHKDAELRSTRHELELTKTELGGKKNEVATLRSDGKLQLEALEGSVAELKALLAKERHTVDQLQLEKGDDKRQIIDLNRQVKEMERILRRNSQSVLQSMFPPLPEAEADCALNARVKQLEGQLQQFQAELELKEEECKSTIINAEKTLITLKSEYEKKISDLESTVKAAVSKKVEREAPKASSKKTAKEDANLLGSLRGLQQELATKEKEIHRLNRELEESRKTNRRLQKEREKILNLPSTPVKEAQKRDNSNTASNLSSPGRTYLAEKYASEENNEDVVKLEEEKQKILHDLVQLSQDFEQLKLKRIKDLHMLQEHHNLEVRKLLEERSNLVANPKIAELQNQLSTQQLIIDHLKDKLKQVDLLQEEMVAIKSERDYLENNVIELQKKLVNLQHLHDPETDRLLALQEQLTALELRHKNRESRLQAVVQDLLKRNAEQRTKISELHADDTVTGLRQRLTEKNRQLLLYRAEMDRIMEALKEVHRTMKSSDKP